MDKKFNVPEKTFKELNEFSGGGFILFIYDENGHPRVYADFDSAAYGLGMQKFIQNWLSVVDTINLENSMDEIHGHSEEQPPTE